MKMKLIKII